jgi:hypothetical protein
MNMQPTQLFMLGDVLAQLAGPTTSSSSTPAWAGSMPLNTKAAATTPYSPRWMDPPVPSWAWAPRPQSPAGSSTTSSPTPSAPAPTHARVDLTFPAPAPPP